MHSLSWGLSLSLWPSVNSIGFLVTSAVLLFVLMKKLGVPTLRSAIASICITLFINIMFLKILRVPLPPGILGW